MGNKKSVIAMADANKGRTAVFLPQIGGIAKISTEKYNELSKVHLAFNVNHPIVKDFKQFIYEVENYADTESYILEHYKNRSMFACWHFQLGMLIVLPYPSAWVMSNAGFVDLRHEHNVKKIKWYNIQNLSERMKIHYDNVLDTIRGGKLHGKAIPLTLKESIAAYTYHLEDSTYEDCDSLSHCGFGISEEAKRVKING